MTTQTLDSTDDLKVGDVVKIYNTGRGILGKPQLVDVVTITKCGDGWAEGPTSSGKSEWTIQRTFDRRWLDVSRGSRRFYVYGPRCTVN